MIFFLICFFLSDRWWGGKWEEVWVSLFQVMSVSKKKESPWQQRREIMEYWVEGKGGGAREEV